MTISLRVISSTGFAGEVIQNQTTDLFLPPAPFYWRQLKQHWRGRLKQCILNTLQKGRQSRKPSFNTVQHEGAKLFLDKCQNNRTIFSKGTDESELDQAGNSS